MVNDYGIEIQKEPEMVMVPIADYEADKKRIKDLEAVISKMETTTPKWISVEDRLPEENPMLPALTEDGNKIWWGTWHDGNLEIYGITHWLDNAFPPPPTTEDSSTTEKENEDK